MKFGIMRVSGDYPLGLAKEEQWFNPYLDDYEVFYTIEIGTLEELLKIKKICGSRVIIDNIDSWEKKYIEVGCKGKIIIYDNYLEQRQTMLEDLREVLKGIISIEDLEKAIEYSASHEECEDNLPYLEIEKERIYCEFRKDNREVRITIQNIRGTRYYFLCGSTYENNQWVNDEEIADFEIYLNRFKETLENYIE